MRELKQSDIVEIYTIRTALEGICCNKTAREISDANLLALEKNLEQAQAKLKAGDAEGAAELGEMLHEMVIRVGGGARFDEIIERMKAQTLRLHAIATHVTGRVEKSLQEHREVISALKMRDGALAEQRMRVHIESTQEDVLRALRNMNI